ncbi:sulfatase [Ruficoccus amylovorans]|uniref:Sulfatase n=1 Tax=Ruficoccus amylovorans TaxID=1804625 RepID=A0A842HJ59_9BACT|nr:sulfatase [Ruficoccus amylovorans]MBC2595211.1 sulfatase [Ruficoccus amylovorans]
MKVIYVMFDSLNRHMLPPYGGSIVAPNFERLARQSVTFDTSYVCSMPCMPARRDLHTGRPNFLHRGWGPLEPCDDSMPRILKEAGVYTHLISDHGHYWEEGGTNYHTKYNTWECIRGQEGDPWIPQVRSPDPIEAHALRNCSMKLPADDNSQMVRQDAINRQVMPDPHLQPMSQVFTQAREFLDRNRDEDNWFLQIETFDPHEPFFSHRRYKDLYREHYGKYKGRDIDWPPYRRVEESPEEVEHMRYQYAALVSMCDEKLGDVLDYMDAHQMWDDTMLIVGTDHGFLLGEHDCWAKCWMPFYEEVARTPFFVWDPRCRKRGERRQSLVQPAIDIAPTVLNFFDLCPTPRMSGHNLAATIATDKPVRETAVFGMFGAHVNITDGRHVYMRGNPPDAENAPLNAYTLMPAHMRAAFSTEVFQQPFEPVSFGFTQGCHLMKLPSGGGMPGNERISRTFGTLLFDLEADPQQQSPLTDEAVENRLLAELDRHLHALDAPAEQWERLGMSR